MKTGTWMFLVGLVPGLVVADDQRDREAVLKQFFEGRSVTIRIDMPATEQGIDVRIGSPVPIDPGSLGDRLGQTGVSLREGARVPVTKVHIKDDLIEFQLGGGGFDWIWESQTKVSPEMGKSRRERELEKEIEEERDSDRRHELERRLREARRNREREEHRRRVAAESENILRDQQDHERALHRGSRFNLRWKDGVPPPAQSPQAVMELLSPWVDFSGFPGAPEPPRLPRGTSDDTPPLGPDVRKGMSWADVQDRLGAPDHLETSHDGDLPRSQAVYGARGLELTFVNDILVRIQPLEPEPR